MKGGQWVGGSVVGGSVVGGFNKTYFVLQKNIKTKFSALFLKFQPFFF